MTLTWIWTSMIVISLIYAILSGNTEALTTAVTQGASSAVSLCIDICGITCLWCGIMKVLEYNGIIKKFAHILSPLINKILPSTLNKPKSTEYIAANISANLLGLGNAATPLGLKAISELYDNSGTATNDMCTFTVLNTASIQLIPITVAAVRTANGSSSPFDILPAIWITSLLSVSVGVLTSKLLSKI